MSPSPLKWKWIALGMPLALGALLGERAWHHLPYHGVVEEVAIQSGGTRLAGVLVKPRTPAPHPAVVLLHGSGANQVRGKWHYRIHTNAFVRHGFAVLSYDKRGCGESQGDLRKASFKELVGDGSAAVALLRSRPDVRADRVGLFAISESGWYAPEIASGGGVAFIANRVAPPLPWTDTVLFELRTSAVEAGLSGQRLDQVLALQARIWSFYRAAAADAAVADGPERRAITAAIAEMQGRADTKGFFGPLAEYDREAYALRASKYAYDPKPFLTRLEIPMLYVLGGRDVNVPFEPSLAALEKLKREHGKDISIQVYPEAGHYMYRWDRLPVEGAYVPGYLERIAGWARAQVATEREGDQS